MKKSNRKLTICSLLSPVEDGLALTIGVVVSYFGFTNMALLLLCFYPLVVLADPTLWRKVYGDLARGVGFKASFLVNLDMLYWFAVGWVVGWVL